MPLVKMPPKKYSQNDVDILQLRTDIKNLNDKFDERFTDLSEKIAVWQGQFVTMETFNRLKDQVRLNTKLLYGAVSVILLSVLAVILAKVLGFPIVIN